MNIAAIKHLSFGNFCYALDEDTLEINLTTGKDVEKVFLTHGDPFVRGIFGGGSSWEGTEVEVSAKKELQAEIRWTARLRPEFKRCRYYFRLVSGTEEMYLLETGFFTPEQFAGIKDFTGCFCFPWLNPSDVTRPPRWTEKAVWYQIFPARFARGKIGFQVKDLLPWGRLGEEVRHGKEPRYGGNLQGITDRLDYIESLGITGIYMTPVNLSSSQHKYNTDDYGKIDPEFGGKEAMKKLCAEAHRRGIKIMLDGVFNHSGFEFPMWQDVFKNGKKSRYADWFMVNDYDFVPPSFGKESNAMKKKYSTFAFADYMPKLNTNNPEVIEYIIGICRSWVREYDIDGIRLDVANEISHTFCRELRKAMDEEKKDFYIVGEIWHNAFQWLSSKEFDATMNYPLQNAIADFCLDENTGVKDFEYAVNRCASMYYAQTNRVLFNQMDSHDTMRILNRAGGNRNRARQTLALLFCMPGSVCIYYGTEVMLEGGHDPDCRRCMPWTEIDAGLFDSDIEFTRTLIKLRRSHGAFCSDEMDFMYGGLSESGITEENVRPEDGRFLHLCKKSDEGSIDVFVNCSKKAVDVGKVGKILVESCYSDGKLMPDGLLVVESVRK